MDPPSIVKNVKYNPSSSSQQAMFCVSENPALPYKSLPQINNSGVQRLSFANPIKPNHPPQKTLENHGICHPNDSEISIFDAQKYFSENADFKLQLRRDLGRPSSQDHIPPSVSSADGYGGGRHFGTRSFNATPTASSEASWNSQTGLLTNPVGSIGVSMANFSLSDVRKKRNPVAAKKWIFGRKCCCSGKKSVQVKEATSSSDNFGSVISTENNNNCKSNYKKDNRHKPTSVVDSSNKSEISSLTADILEEIHQAKIRASNPVRLSPENTFPAADGPRQRRISAPGGFSFPILNPDSQSTDAALIKGIMSKTPINIPLEDPPRESLEVFQPINELPSISRIDNPVNSRPQFNPGSPIAPDEDMCSDASSDLFEIESFSTQTTSYPMYRRRDSLDEAPTFNARRFAAANGLNLNNNGGSGNQFGRRSLDEPPTPSVAVTECYAPSEVSIDWSVTTAEGFDKASVSNFSVSASEIGSAAIFRQRMEEESSGGGGGGGGDIGKKKGNGGGGGLLLMSCRQEKAVSVGPQPVKFSQAEGRQDFATHGGGRPPRASKAALESSQSARQSLAFAA